MRNQKYLLVLGLFGILLGGGLTPVHSQAGAPFFEPLPDVLQQAPATFLHPPYYGTEQANCVFDHEYPLYRGEGGVPTTRTDVITTVVHYDGIRGANARHPTWLPGE